MRTNYSVSIVLFFSFVNIPTIYCSIVLGYDLYCSLVPQRLNPALWLVKDRSAALYYSEPGSVRTLIALYHGRKTKNESFASCRGRVNISGVSKVAWINVECNEDSLSVAVPSKVKKSSQACATLVILPWQVRCSEATDEIQIESKLQPCPRIYSFGSSHTHSRWLCE